MALHNIKKMPIDRVALQKYFVLEIHVSKTIYKSGGFSHVIKKNVKFNPFQYLL